MRCNVVTTKIAILSAMMVSAMYPFNAQAYITNFHIGVGSGVSHSKVKFTYDDGTQGMFGIHGKGNGSGRTPHGALNLGYGWLLSNLFYVGIEGQADYNFSGSQKFLKNNALNIKGKRDGGGYALLGRLGYMMPSKNLIYVGLGVKRTKWHFNVKNTVSNPIPPNNQRISKHFTSFTGEVGIEGPLTEKTRWRVSYHITQGKKLRYRRFKGGHVLAGNNSSASFKPTEQMVRLGVGYYF